MGREPDRMIINSINQLTMKQTLFILLAALLLASCNGKAGEALQDSDAMPVVREQYVAECQLSGSGITNEYEEVTVFRADQLRFMNKEQPAATFPVKDGSFDGTAMLDTTLVYGLVFSVPGSGMAMVRCFVPTTAGVSFKGPDSIMDPESAELLSNTPENEYLNEYEGILKQLTPLADPIYEEYDRLASENALFNDEVNAMLEEANSASRERMMEIYQEFNKLQNLDESYSEEGLRVKRKLDAFFAMSDSLCRVYVSSHPSISTFYRIYTNIQNAGDNPAKMQSWTDLYDNSYASLFQEHPYHSLILSLTNNRVGDHIRDFTLPDSKGEQRKLSDLTAGKFAVVDFWASWCGSCRIRSKALIPIYEQYAGDDFTVVGVALEYKNDAAWRKALSRDGYPWTNLIAIDAPPTLMANHAKAFVLDRDGTILTIDPSVEELDSLLQEKLKP